jgi:hypothetical protein
MLSDNEVAAVHKSIIVLWLSPDSIEDPIPAHATHTFTLRRGFGFPEQDQPTRPPPLLVFSGSCGLEILTYYTHFTAWQ